MKNVSSLNANNNNSPKTPGGISKSLLTPCRRVGLSRNWRKSGPSPFVSPLASTSNTIEVGKEEIRKSKENLSTEKSPDISDDSELNVTNIDTTPKNIANPRRKRSKLLIPEVSTLYTDTVNDEIYTMRNNTTPLRNEYTLQRKNTKMLISTIESSQEDIKTNIKPSDSEVESIDNIPSSRNIDILLINKTPRNYTIIQENNSSPSKYPSENCFKVENSIDSKSRVGSTIENVVSTPVRSKSKSKKSLALKTSVRESIPEPVNKLSKSDKANSVIVANGEGISYNIKERSPNDLKKECVVVIQRKVFKNIKSNNAENLINDAQCPRDEIVDSEDDTPLINLHNQNSIEVDSNEDDDFVNNDTFKVKTVKLTDTKPHKITKVKSTKITRNLKDVVIKDMTTTDDEDFDNKKTILIRKTYEKVTKPIKAKSTGSITQSDIDNLRNKIEIKKKILLAQSLTPDTEELRTLIKKWQKGCQDALIELLDLMKAKFSDKERMDYSDMLKTLKIPPSLVGYDSDNDCFHSPDDASIILGQFKDL